MRLLFAITLLFVSPFAFGQSALDGHWHGTMGRMQLPIQVVFSGRSGTWTAHPVGRVEDACADRPVPFEITKDEGAELVLDVLGSKVLAGCPNATITLKKVDEKNLAGAPPSGHRVKLTKD